MQGYTRVSALGPIAEFVEKQGGSIEKIFNRVDLPLSLLQYPDLPLPLREQFKVLSQAGREISDPFFGAGLGQHVDISTLGAFGQWITSAPTLASAIERSGRGLNRYLQTKTDLQLEILQTKARWSIKFLDVGADGRFQNELLAIGYLVDLVRKFVGQAWSPSLIWSTCTGLRQATALEKVFKASVMHNMPVSSIEFDLSLLSMSGRRHINHNFGSEAPIPTTSAYHSEVTALTAIALLEGFPKIDWVASKLEMSRRSLQRSLEAEGHSFSNLVDSLLQDRAMYLLETTNHRLVDIALQLGYSDGGHFSRAFRRWTGLSPSQYRNWKKRNVLQTQD